MLWRIPKGCRRCKALRAESLRPKDRETQRACPCTPFFSPPLPCFRAPGRRAGSEGAAKQQAARKKEERLEALFDAINDALAAIDDFIWGPPLMALILFGGILLTLRLRGLQFIRLPRALRYMVKNEKDGSGEVTSFGALCTALSATIGTGNIVGVGTAVLAGGPGAILWMWLTGVFGMATKYAETFAAVKYRVKDHSGKMLGGAMYALERGFKNKKLGRVLAVLFALFASLAAFGIGASTQSNSLADALYNTSLIDGAAIPQWLVGIVVVALVAIVILGGIKSISRVCEKLVPVMAIFYVACCIIIIGINGQFLGEAIRQIIVGAFTPAGAAGGAVGSTVTLALQFGFKRGIFSNESGMGSAPLVASSATTKNPARQALVSMTGTFWDTVVVCLLTGLMLMTTLLANPELSTAIANGTISSGAGLATAAFEKIPAFGPLVLLVGLITFTYSTILGWSQYGNRAISYLLGKKAVLPYYIVFLLFVFWGCMMVGDATGSAAVSNLSSVVWNFADVMNALMAIPNCIAVLGLSAIIARETKHYVYDGNLDEVDDTEIPQYDEK